ncbi:MAG: tRNA pseudouridine(38-40) synthase TruA [Treponemataceae bacterium]|nr:MAG: tRNA pseudouridine(38-40) synthase TruA [Treponemataceae bacterium]
MRNILLIISYDGTRFCGWQKQASARTVQGEIERALCRLHHTQSCEIHGSGRTDSGVHAAGQAANFFSPVDSIPAEKYPFILNNMLPTDIRIHSAREAPHDFHARFSAVSRTYRYFFRAASVPAAHEAPFVWVIKKKPDITKLNAMAAFLAGETDCSAFAAAGDVSRSKFRYIEKAIFFPHGNGLVFEIRANAFLWKMARSLAGTLIQAEREGKSAAYFKEILDSRDRTRAGETAPPRGLFLWHVDFEGSRKIPAQLV